MTKRDETRQKEKPHKPLYYRGFAKFYQTRQNALLHLGVVEAASSSLVTQTKNGQPSGCPFFLILRWFWAPSGAFFLF